MHSPPQGQSPHSSQAAPLSALNLGGSTGGGGGGGGAPRQRGCGQQACAAAGVSGGGDGGDGVGEGGSVDRGVCFELRGFGGRGSVPTQAQSAQISAHLR